MSGLKRLMHEIHRRSLWQVLVIYLGGRLMQPRSRARPGRKSLATRAVRLRVVC